MSLKYRIAATIFALEVVVIGAVLWITLGHSMRSTREQIEQLRPLSTPVNTFQFGHQTITTQVYVMVPRKLATVAPHVDVTAAMEEQPRSRAVSLKVVSGSAASLATSPVEDDPFAEVEV